jgi:hypothetical protein
LSQTARQNQKTTIVVTSPAPTIPGWCRDELCTIFTRAVCL